MTNNVTDFKARPPEIKQVRQFVCADCGCMSFEIFDDNGLRCAGCSNELDALELGWTPAVLPDYDEDPQPEGFVASIGDDGDTFQRKRIADLAGGDDVAMVVVARSGGGVHCWTFPMEGESQKAWLERRLSEAKDIMIAGLPEC